MCLLCHIIGKKPHAREHRFNNCTDREEFFKNTKFIKCMHCGSYGGYVYKGQYYCFGDCNYDRYGNRK
jgi:hypothetical protein